MILHRKVRCRLVFRNSQMGLNLVEPLHIPARHHVTFVGVVSLHPEDDGLEVTIKVSIYPIGEEEQLTPPTDEEIAELEDQIRRGRAARRARMS